MDLKEAKEKLYETQRKLTAYRHALSLLNYDGLTAAPSGTAENRAASSAVLASEVYRISTDPENEETLFFLEENGDSLSAKEKRMVYLCLKGIKEMKKIPMDEYVAFRSLVIRADDVWHRAKENDDFELFRPYLEEIFETTKRFALYVEPDADPYDHCLSDYEKGMNKQTLDKFFSSLREGIVPLIKEVSSGTQVDDSIRHGVFPARDQEKLAKYLMTLIGLDPAHVALATTEHPFTTTLGSHLDTRITTHYYEDDFASSMYSVIHEGGHALYETGSDEDLAFTVLDGGTSMGIHESQSRFYENIIGRSRAFCELVFPKIREIFPEQMKSRSAEELYRAVNRVEPSLIRTEADEVTYSMHIMVRYELEKAVMAGDLKVAELPGEWRRLYREYLGIEPKDDRTGVLQDTHWSGGMIGYFPSYALGNAYGAQFLKKMKETVDFEECISRGDFSPVNEWCRENIWRHGALYTPAELLDRVLGEPFDPGVYVGYLISKCRDVYGIK